MLGNLLFVQNHPNRYANFIEYVYIFSGFMYQPAQGLGFRIAGFQGLWGLFRGSGPKSFLWGFRPGF